VYNNTPVILIYCDNQGVLDCIQKLPATKPIQPRQTTQDDYDVYAAIRSTLQELEPLQIQLRHVKGHQDQRKKCHQLLLPEILNIECDKCASDYLQMA